MQAALSRNLSCQKSRNGEEEQEQNVRSILLGPCVLAIAAATLHATPPLGDNENEMEMESMQCQTTRFAYVKCITSPDWKSNGANLEFVELQLALPGLGGEGLYVGRDLRQRLVGDVGDDRRDQPRFGRNRHRNVDVGHYLEEIRRNSLKFGEIRRNCTEILI